jgi:hypothetical protein
MLVGVGSASARQATKRVTGRVQPSMEMVVEGGEEEETFEEERLEEVEWEEGKRGGRSRR